MTTILNPRLLRGVFACAALTGLILAPIIVRAAPPSDLAAAFKRLDDSENQRVPLIVVIGINTLPLDDAWSRINELYARDDARPTVEQVAPLFGRQRITCGSVQVLAPATQVSLNPEPGPPIDWAKIGRDRAAHCLFASFNAAQWEKVSSTEGIALSDLATDEQRTWFQALIPAPFVLQRAHMAEGGGIDLNPPASTTVLPDEVHLSVHRSASFSLGSEGANNSFTMISFGRPEGSGHKTGDFFWQQVTPVSETGTGDVYRDRLQTAVRIVGPNRLKHSDIAFDSEPLAGRSVRLAGAKNVGQVVRRIAEATGLELYVDRRMGGLFFSFLGPEDADVDAGDLLKALCYAVAGAVRRVDDPERGGSIYLLTNDREGYMVKRLRLADWAGDVQALQNQDQSAFQKAARDGNVLQGIGFAHDDPITLNDAAMRSAEADMEGPDPWKYHGRVSLSDLSPAAQAQAKEDMETAKSSDTRFMQNGVEIKPTFDSDHVYAQLSVNIQLVVPGYGSFPGPALGSLSEFLPSAPSLYPPPATDATGPIALPDPLRKFVALQIAPAEAADVETAAAWAHRHGFTALFVDVPFQDPANTATLIAAAVHSGKRYSLSIYPAVSLLRIPASATAPSHPMRNITGETLRGYASRRITAPAIALANYLGDHYQQQSSFEWADTADAPTRATLAQQLNRVAKLAGIAGVVLTDIAAPGTASSDGTELQATQLGLSGGYDLASRIALIRSQNIDPVDLSIRYGMPPELYNLRDGFMPFFPDSYDLPQAMQNASIFQRAADGTWTEQAAGSAPQPSSGSNDPQAAWNALRRETNRRRLGEIRSAANLPKGLPIFLALPAEFEFADFPRCYALWADSEPLPPLDVQENALLPYTLMARATEQSVRFGVGRQLLDRMRTRIPSAITNPGSSTGKANAYNGVVFDASAFSVEKGLSLLDVLATIPE